MSSSSPRKVRRTSTRAERSCQEPPQNTCVCAVTATPQSPLLARQRARRGAQSHRGYFYPPRPEARRDSRSSDLELATCRDRLTTSASRPRNPEPKPTRHNAVNPLHTSRDSVNPSLWPWLLPRIPARGASRQTDAACLRSQHLQSAQRGGEGAATAGSVPELVFPGSPNSSSRAWDRHMAVEG